MFDPANDDGEDLAVFQVGIGADGELGNARLTPGEWHDVTLEWDLSDSQCVLLVDDEPAGTVSVLNQTLNGISYIRFRSAARQIDKAGFLVDSVTIAIEDPYAPRCSETDKIQHERLYIEKVVPNWQ